MYLEMIFFLRSFHWSMHIQTSQWSQTSGFHSAPVSAVMELTCPRPTSFQIYLKYPDMSPKKFQAIHPFHD